MAYRVHTEKLVIETAGKGTYEITAKLKDIMDRSEISNGIATVFVRHTSCSLCIMENADPTARKDLDAFFERLVPEDEPYFVHTYEGGDDMPSHIKMVLTDVDKNIPVMNKQIALGTWQGLFLFEHRRAPHVREIIVSVHGS